MRIIDWSSDVCSSDLISPTGSRCPCSSLDGERSASGPPAHEASSIAHSPAAGVEPLRRPENCTHAQSNSDVSGARRFTRRHASMLLATFAVSSCAGSTMLRADSLAGERSEEHTSELQSLMRISYAVFCLKKQKKQ